jgi:hypothetical protein
MMLYDLLAYLALTQMIVNKEGHDGVVVTYFKAVSLNFPRRTTKSFKTSAAAEIRIGYLVNTSEIL